MEDHLLTTFAGRHDYGAARHEAGEQAVADGKRFMPIEVNGRKAEDQHEPDHQTAQGLARTGRRAQMPAASISAIGSR